MRVRKTLASILASIAAAANLAAASMAQAEAPTNYQTFPAIGGGGGQNFSLYCDHYTYLAGVQVRVGHDVDAISPICREQLLGGGAGPIRNSYHFYGGRGGDLQVIQCPEGQPFVRYLWVFAEGRENVLVNTVQIRCGVISGPLATLVPGYNDLKVSGLYYPLPDDGRTKGGFECPAGMAFAGLHGRAGQMVDALGAACKTVIQRANAASAPPVRDGEWTSPLYGGGGGNPFASACPARQYLAGFRARGGHDIDAIGPICATSLSGGSRGALSHPPSYGGEGGTFYEFRCPPSEPFVRSIAARTGGEDTQLLGRFSVQCGPFKGPVPGPTAYNSMSVPKDGPSWPTMRRNFSFTTTLLTCPDGMMYAGFHGRAGSMVDAIGIICARAVTTLASIGKKTSPPVIKGEANNDILNSPALERATPATPDASRTATATAVRGRARHSTDPALTPATGSASTSENELKPEASSYPLHEPPGKTPPAASGGGTLQQPATGSGAVANPATGAAAAAAADIKTVELICRGGNELRIENKGVKTAPNGHTSASIHLFFAPNFATKDARGTYAPDGPEGKGLQPSNCSFADRRWSPDDPQGIYFETALHDAEADAKRMLHEAHPRGSAPDPRKAAETRPNEKTIPLYLEVPEHFWSFTAYRTNYGHFVATEHRPWKPKSTTAEP